MAVFAVVLRGIAVVLGGPVGSYQLRRDFEPGHFVALGYLGQVVEVVLELIGQTAEAFGQNLIGKTAVCFAAVVLDVPD